MTDKVSSLAERRAVKAQEDLDAQTCRGEAFCYNCDHRWQAVTPIGTVWLECPKCFRAFGRYLHTSCRSGPHWHCLCGSDIWRIQDDGAYCVDCGAWSIGWRPE